VLEARLSKLPGVRSAKVRGYDRESKYFFNLEIGESQTVLPETIRAMLAQLKKDTRGDEDYPYNSFEVTSLVGTVAKSGDTWSLVARGSKQKYELAPNDALRKLVEGGTSLLSVAGKLTDEKGRLLLEVSEAKVPAN
jgi:hypothetical protein